MHRFIAIVFSIAIACANAYAGGLTAEIKGFKNFPVKTFDEYGNRSDKQLLKDLTPDPALISLDGWWPDKKMLLITFTELGERVPDSYFVLFSTVDMNDQARWDREMTATGGIQCSYKKVVGTSPQKDTAATKRFASPC